MPADDGRERGAALAEFVLVMVPLLTLVFALLSLGLFGWARVLLTSAATDAARYAANADVASAVVAERARETMSHTIASSAAGTVVCARDDVGAVVGVTCTMRAPGLIPLLDGLFPDITVTGHSLKETVG